MGDPRTAAEETERRDPREHPAARNLEAILGDDWSIFTSALDLYAITLKSRSAALDEVEVHNALTRELDALLDDIRRRHEAAAWMLDQVAVDAILPNRTEG